MTRSRTAFLSRALLAAALAGAVVSPSGWAKEPPAGTAPPPATAPAKPQSRPAAAPAAHEAADAPAPKHGRNGEPDAGFVKRHEGFLKDLAEKNGKVDLLLVGDSITDGWRNPPERNGGRDVLAKAWGEKMSVLNIGISGDHTQHVLWRLDRGEVEGISPKVAMLMIGTNNLGGNTDEEIVAGVTKIVKELNEKLPKTKVLLLAVFPRDMQPDTTNRKRIKAINAELAKLDDGGKTVKFLDIGEKFLDDKGVLPKDVMPDALHPNAKGYQIWADAVQPTLDELMK